MSELNGEITKWQFWPFVMRKWERDLVHKHFIAGLPLWLRLWLALRTLIAKI